MIELHDFSIGYGERTLLCEVEATIEKGKLTAPYRAQRHGQIDAAPRHRRTEPPLCRSNPARRA